MTDEFLFGPETEGPVRARIRGECYPHRQLWWVVLENLTEMLDEEPERFVPTGVSALLVTHSCLEGYLNFAGELLFGPQCWEELSFLRVSAKLALIARELSVDLDRSRRPLQTVMLLNKWRNRMMHGRIERYDEHVQFREAREVQNLAGKFFEEVTVEFVRRARHDVEELCDSLQAAGHEKDPSTFLGPGAFQGILGQAGGTLLRDAPGDEAER